MVGLISGMGAMLDWVQSIWVQLGCDQEPDAAVGMKSYHLAMGASACDQRSLRTALGGRQGQPSSACS